VASTPAIVSDELEGWRSAGWRYHALSYHLQRKFGRRVQKVSLDAGLTCPNVDGKVATGGCNFCDNRSFSPSRRIPRRRITDQLQVGIGKLKRRYRVDRFLAYFQPATNTYAPVEKLRALWEEALTHPEVVGLVIGTRPDCVPDEILDLIAEFAQRTYVSVEFGVQTVHDRTLDWMNRGHHHDATIDALTRSRGRGFEVCAHVILGFPQETLEEMLSTVVELVRLQVDAIKLHNLYVVHGTPLADDYEAGKVRLFTRDEFIDAIIRSLELLPPRCVVERVTGEAPPDYLIAPTWCLDKPALKTALEAEMDRRKSWQGKQYIPPSLTS